MLARGRQSAPAKGRMIHRPRVWSRALPFQQFHVLFNPLFKVLFIFRSLYLCAIGLRPVFSLRRSIPPTLHSIPKLCDSSKGGHTGSPARRTGLSPSTAPPSRETGREAHRTYPLQITTRTLKPGPDFKSGLLPLHSPLLGQSQLLSFPPLIDMLKFSGYSHLIRGQHQGPIETELPYGLGSADPRPTAVHAEPFPTSVLQVLIEVFATLTKICTRGSSTRARALGFVTATTSAYSTARRSRAVGGVWAGRLSAIHFQG